MNPGFLDGISQREIRVSCGAVKSPCCHYDSSAVHAAFTVATACLAPLLPDADLHPVELRRGRALLSVTALEHRRSDLGPYRELIVGPLVVFGRRPVRVLDALAAVVRRTVRVHVLHRPVTTRMSYALGAEIFGYPEVVADVAFAHRGASIEAVVTEGGREVLTLAADALPPHASRRAHATLYSTREGALLEAQVEMDLLALGQSFRHGAATLQLGLDHPIATALASLDLDPRAVLVQSCPRAEIALYAPHPAHVPMRRAA